MAPGTAFLLAASSLFAADPAEFFEMRVRPVLARNCFGCHAASKLGGLDLSSRESALQGGKRGPALIPGDAGGSPMIRAIRHDGDLKMPPNAKLPGNEVDDLTEWVRAGAVWPGRVETKADPMSWWSLQPVRKPVPPKVKDATWAETPLDRFILAPLEAKGLTPAEAASKRTLVRRAYFDLTGLPPTQDEVDEFVADRRPDAWLKLVDRLLASRHYGERQGRYWLDIARYSDDRLNSTQDSPYENAWRYRDWVIGAFNDDMPYDLFLKAQIAGDQLNRPDRDKLVAGTGFFALSPEFQDDRVDVTARGFLGLTVACAQCHDHKFDPIPQKDYYALAGVFGNSAPNESPLAPEAEVKDYKKRKAAVDDKQREIDEFMARQARELAEIFAAQAGDYLKAARTGEAAGSLDPPTLERWRKYLARKDREHRYLDGWEKPDFDDDAFRTKLLAVIAEKHRVDKENVIRLGGNEARRNLAGADLLALPRDDYFLWRDLMSETKAPVFYYAGQDTRPYLKGVWAAHHDREAEELGRRRRAMPPAYAFYHVMKENEKLNNQRIRIRGQADNPGDEVPRAFLTALSGGAPKPFQGGGRLELADAIASPSNPLTARVIANRIWQQHFGTALVSTPSNLGRLGGVPTHPELLDWLASRLMESGWSIKALHREIMLSRVYRAGSRRDENNFTADPTNSLYWRANRRRLDVEPLRDTLLAVSGELDRAVGGPPVKLTESTNRRRTVYGFVSRRKLDGTLSLFDFPNPNSHSEQRFQTATPLQELFFLNSGFVRDRAAALGKRLADAGTSDVDRIRAAYRAVFARAAEPAEIAAGAEFLRSEPKDAWTRYAQALLSANELLFVD